jgi:glycosyltransferase involved in cell wall biosynthesis
LSIGRLVEKKGLIHLVRAVAQLRARGLVLKCKIVGEGPEKRRLRQEIERLGLQSEVVLTGPQQHQRIRELLQRYSCFVLPCIRAADGNMDGVPNVLLEALACECPCVSTSLSGIPEIIKDRVTGLLVEPGDETALANAIETVVTDMPRASEWAAAGRRLVEEHFDIHRNIATLYGWLHGAAEAARRRVDAHAVQSPSSHLSRASET